MTLDELRKHATELDRADPLASYRDRFHIPGTRVLQFAFDGNSQNPHLPQNHPANAVVYTGTHDNNTTRGWFEALPEKEQANVRRQLNRKGGDSLEVTEELLRLAWSSNAALAIAPLQDLLNLGAEARMNTPGTMHSNWSWRTSKEVQNAAPFHRLCDLTSASNRSQIRSRSDHPNYS